MSEEIDVKLIDWGQISYKDAWSKQDVLHKSIVDIKLKNRSLCGNEKVKTSNYLVLCEHPPVYTLGKSGKKQHLLINEQALQKRGIEYFEINRGGDITFHGLGQVVGYPILDLDNFKTDLHWYLRTLEQVIIDTVADYGLKGFRIKDATGVWVNSNGFQRKICAMGIRCSRWVTMHGWALNVNTELKYFNDIVPCGITDKGVTSLKNELGVEVNINEVKGKLVANFLKLFAKIE